MQFVNSTSVEPAPVPLSAVDLNLIGPLEALLRERHVSRAAEAMGMSQPAMSRALRALRGVFGDELLVRDAPTGYRLTPRAERLQRELTTTVPRLRSLFSDERFDPRLAAQAFNLAGTDYVLELLAPGLVAAAHRGSPGSTLQFTALTEDGYRNTERGAIDLVLAGPFAPPPLRTEVLFHDDYICVMAAAHPLAVDLDAPIGLADYSACAHAVVSILGGRQGAVDRQLDASGLRRRTGVVVPFHALAASVVAGTELLATLPRRLVARLGLDDRFAVRPAPTLIDGMDFVMSWHPRLDADPAQQWLRDIAREVARSL